MPADSFTVSALSAAPVKGLRIAPQRSLHLERGSIVGDRHFYLIDADSRMVNGKRALGLQSVVAEYEEAQQQLTLRFPDASSVSARVELGEQVRTRFYSSVRVAQLVKGPFARAISEHSSAELRLVACGEGESAADRGPEGAVSLISRASLARLAEVAGEHGGIDARRFRMSIELDGVAAHAEDDWVGARLRVGGATVRLCGHVGRCIVTTRNPDSDEVDLPTLELLRSYRAGLARTEPLPFGVYGEVLEPGLVRVGDGARLEPAQDA